MKGKVSGASNTNEATWYKSVTVSRLYLLDIRCPKKTRDTFLDKVRFCTKEETERRTPYRQSGDIRQTLTNFEIQLQKKLVLYSWGSNGELAT